MGPLRDFDDPMDHVHNAVVDALYEVRVRVRVRVKVRFRVRLR